MMEEKKTKASKINEPSPMMQQYLQIKEEYKDCLLFYRLGDFYEFFFEDAIEVSRVLELTLTGKICGMEEKAPMCGIPFHSAEGYIDKLIAMGYKVAICEQIGEPGKETMQRSVVRVITAGTITEGNLLKDEKNNFLMSIFLSGNKLSAAWVDITTGDLNLAHFEGDVTARFSDLLGQVSPSQVIGDATAKAFYEALPIHRIGGFAKFEQYFDYAYAFPHAQEAVAKKFGANAENVFELKSNKEDIPALGGLIEYLNDTQKRALANIFKINKVSNAKFMTIDSSTRRNLELVETIRERKRYGSLIWLLDRTKTAMGARLFKVMFDQPLQNVGQINDRLDAVEEFSKNLIMRDRLSEALSAIRDVERICGKIAYGNATPQELLNLKVSLAQIPVIKEILSSVKSKNLVALRDGLAEFPDIVDLLERAIDPSATLAGKEYSYIRAGFNDELEQFRHAKETATQRCKALELAETEATGIRNLKISYNSVFGFYIDVPKTQTDKVPLRYVRKQTLKDSERYISSDLKEIEEQFFTSSENAQNLEAKLFRMILEHLSKFLEKFSDVAKKLAEIDALLSMAQAAVKFNFCRPTVKKNGAIKIEQGRHPIVENFSKNSNFIANDTLLDSDENKMMIITGPNMAGKSTYMRQVAIITFLAHIGSFVPAKSAEISLTDRIFTRVGASDDLAFGQSTFMVEMSEVANILQNATDKSLVILDEIGRGTSTFDGLAIAWAVVEHICKNLSCKTLFATHYHELSELEGLIHGVKNYKITVKEVGDSIVFMRKIVRGSANKSFGVEVARLAGVPQNVIERAKEISVNLEKVNQKLDMNVFGEDEEKRKQLKNEKRALSILNSLKDIDMNRISPLESFSILNDFVEQAKQD